MRGFFLGCFVLVFLDVALHSPTSQFAELVWQPAAWLAKWMDPGTTLISAPVPASSSSGSGSSGPPPKTDKLGEPVGGQKVVIGGKTYTFEGM